MNDGAIARAAEIAALVEMWRAGETIHPRSDIRTRMATTPPWKKKRPKQAPKKLTPKKRAKAKARAKSAGRTYPNLVDNMWAVGGGKKKKKKAAKKKTAKKKTAKKR